MILLDHACLTVLLVFSPYSEFGLGDSRELRDEENIDVWEGERCSRRFSRAIFQREDFLRSACCKVVSDEVYRIVSERCSLEQAPKGENPVHCDVVRNLELG